MAKTQALGRLRDAIEGYKGETAGTPGHEDVHALLDRAASEAERGHSTPQDSPGRREASSAASEAYQRNHPSEEGHSGGEGNTRPNAPGSAHPADQPPDIGRDGANTADKLKGSGPVPSHDNLHSVASATGFSGGDASIRRIAAERELSRPDSKFKAKEGKAGGNKESVDKAPPADRGDRIGDVSAPPITNTQKRGEAAKAGATADNDADDPYGAGTPPYAKESLAGDGFSRAAAKTKARLAMKAGAQS